MSNSKNFTITIRSFVILAGGAAGAVEGNRHVKCAQETPMTNLLVSMLDKSGVPVESLGDSTGTVVGL